MNKLNSINPMTPLEPTSSRSPDILIIVRALWAGKWRIAGMMAIALTLAVIYVATSEPVYVATTTLSLQPPEREVVEFASATDPATQEKKAETEAEVLRSRRMAQKLVEELSLLEDPEFNGFLQTPEFPSIGWLRGKIGEMIGSEEDAPPDPQVVMSATILRTLASIEVFPVLNTFLIELKVTSSSPTKSAEMANTLARLYIADGRNSRSATDEQEIEWLSGQVDKLKDALEAAERKQKEYRVSTELMSPEALEAQNQQLKSLRERHQRTVSQVALAEARADLLERLLTGATPEDLGAVAADPAISMLVGPTGTNGGAKPMDRGRVLVLMSAAKAEADRESRIAETTADAIADLEARIGRQSDEMLQVRQIEREVEASAEIYQFALARLKQLSVERALERPLARIVSEAEPPLGPAGPGASVIGALAIAVGGMLGAGLILIKQGVQDTFRTAEEVESLSGVPVVGQIPALRTKRRQKVMRHIVSDQATSFSEAVRNLRGSVISMAGNRRVVLMLSSAMPGEGKTTIALALARSLSALGKSVLLVDADMRLRTIGTHFPGLKKSDGLASAIAERDPLSELVVSSEALGVDLLFSGWTSQNAADLFSSQNFRRILLDAKKSYQFTIIDTPPVLVVPDAKLIAPHVDLAYLVVRWNWTSKWQFTEAVRELLMTKTVLNGCVLSQIDPKGMRKYGYGDRRGIMAGYKRGYYYQ